LQEDKSTGTISFKKSQSPKIGILGSSTFAFDTNTGPRKVSHEPTNTVNNQFKRIEVSLCLIKTIGTSDTGIRGASWLQERGRRIAKRD
jgi:hypothetical protein